MPNIIFCLSDELREMIKVFLQDSKIPWKAKEFLTKELDEVPTCAEDELPFNIEEVDVYCVEEVGCSIEGGKKRKSGGGRGGGGGKSGYNLFIGECMRNAGIRSFGEAPDAMRRCVEEWKKLSEEEKESWKSRARGEEQ